MDYWWKIFIATINLGSKLLKNNILFIYKNSVYIINKNVIKPYINCFCLKLKYPFSATIIWSSTFIPIIEQDLQSLLVISISSEDGSGSPLGWLCRKITEAADSLIAGFNTSLGWTRDFARPVKSIIFY